MKITFLGTSHGYPEKDRFTSSTMIEIGQNIYLLDAGGPAESLMVNRGKSMADVRGIFISHMHGDHIVSLPSLIETFVWFRHNNDVACFMPTQEGMDAFFRWYDALHADSAKTREVVRFSVTRPGVIFENSDIRVTAIPTRHMEHFGEASYAYMMEAEGRRVLFTCDMMARFPEYPDIHKGLHYDLVVSEMAHSTLEASQEALRQTDTDRMLITHYYAPQIVGHETILPTFPFDTQLAYDGMEITL